MTYAGLFKAWATVLAAILVAMVVSTIGLTTGAEAQAGDCTGKVVLDPGHGGTDSGAVNKNGLREKVETLNVANTLRDSLVVDGCTVYMTRTKDETLSNTQRANKANSFKAADPGNYVLVSIHMNGSTNISADYTTTLFGKWRKDKELANTVFGSLSTLPAATGTGTIATRAPYSFASGVLLKSNMPATIAETVFITNTEEANQLANPTTYGRQQQIAEALKVGIENYLANH